MASQDPIENLKPLRALAERIVAATELKRQREKAITAVRRAQCQAALERLRVLGWGRLKIADNLGLHSDRILELERGFALPRPGEPELLAALADIAEGSPDLTARLAELERIAAEFLTAFAGAGE